jgi:ATP phosphoribosyltransferase regulatory subunit
MTPANLAQIAQVRDALIARCGAFVELPTLVPASLVLELAGEGLRPRLFFTTAPDGTEMCLRADLTIPAALAYIEQATHDNAQVAWGCSGPVFRAPRAGDNRPPEFLQIGLERYGDEDVATCDVDVFLAAWDACKIATQKPLHVRFCDGGLLGEVLAQANIPDVWRVALREQSNHPRAFLATLNFASSPSQNDAALPWAKDIDTLLWDDARDLVEGFLATDSLMLGPTRSLDDVTQRLIKSATRAKAQRLDPQTAEVLRALLAFKGTGEIATSLADIQALSARLDVNLTPWRSAWEQRLNAIAKEAPEALAQATFEAIGEEAFDYYDGMAFDIATSTDFRSPIATGGRYDRLIWEISQGARDARAIGCVIRADRFGGGS